ncbi:hypothetical protein O181_105023 [Austropuccinia psidii MF-1]|uniref:Uncharacterized protein n=1 Tax=Austropuccinia psidii MF-1 TaxID=1389203 RepID=A0A9Q3PKK7_9BASI|nr:hypothetical protein [Austropuccinia psidii MF-1]
MEATIQFSPMDVDRQDERPQPDKACLPQERTLWRMPDLAHPPRCVPTSFEIDSKPALIQGNVLRAEPFLSGSHMNISITVQKMVQSSLERGVGNIPKPLEGDMNSFLHINRFLGQENTKELLGGWSPFYCKDKKKELEMTPALEEEGPMVSTSSKPASEVSKDNHKGSQENQTGLKNNKEKFQEKAHWHIPYPQGYRISKFEPWAMESVLNVAITPLKFRENWEEWMNRTIP